MMAGMPKFDWPASRGWRTRFRIARPAAICLAVLVAVLGAAEWSHAQNPRFIYQGRLLEAGAPAAGSFDFQFSLFANAQDGAPIAPDELVIGLIAGDGRFRVGLDFDGALSMDEELWMEIRVRPSGDGDFTLLGPRQSVSAAPSAVLAQAIGAGGVDSASIVDGAVANADFAPGGVGSAAIAANAVGNTKLQNGAVGASEIQFAAVGADQIADAAVDAGKIATGAVGSDQIAENAVEKHHISAAAVGASEIAADAVGAAEIATNAVGSSEISTNAVNSFKIQPNSVGAADINSAEVQRRIDGTCPAEASIRTVQSDGSVTCESDSQGIADFGPFSEFFTFVAGGDGLDTRFMTLTSNSLCMLSQVEQSNLDGPDELGECRVAIAANQWFLQARVSNSNDASVACLAICLPYLVVP